MVIERLFENYEEKEKEVLAEAEAELEVFFSSREGKYRKPARLSHRGCRLQNFCD